MLFRLGTQESRHRIKKTLIRIQDTPNHCQVCVETKESKYLHFLVVWLQKWGQQKFQTRRKPWGGIVAKKQMLRKIESNETIHIDDVWYMYKSCAILNYFDNFMNRLPRPWENRCVIQEPMPSNWPASKTFLDPGKYVKWCELWSSKKSEKMGMRQS